MEVAVHQEGAAEVAESFFKKRFKVHGLIKFDFDNKYFI
jgi:hypothetical protein